MEEEYGGEGIIVEGIAAELRARDIWMRFSSFQIRRPILRKAIH